MRTKYCYGIASLAFFSFLIYATACSARNVVRTTDAIDESKSMLKKNAGDSIATIILKARQVEVSCDTTKTVKLKRNERMLVRYLLADSCNYSQYTAVYGQFYSYFKIVFKYKKNVVTAQYDFRLNQWELLDKNGKLLKLQDLKSKEMFKFARLLFPSDINLIDIQKEQQK